MHDDGAVEGGRLAQHVLHLGNVVAVDRADVANAEGIEEVAGLEHLAEGSAQALHAGLEVFTQDGDLAQRALGHLPAAHVGRARPQAGDARRQAGDRRRVGTPVVVEDDQHLAAAVPEVVEGLVGHAAGHRSVADHGDHAAVVLGTGEVQRRGYAVGVAQDGRGVAVLDPVVLGLGP